LKGFTPDNAPPSIVLVVGCGFIGARFARESLARGFETVVLTRTEPESSTAAAIAKAELVVGNARDPELVRKLLRPRMHVVYAAGGLMPAQSEQNPSLDAALTFPPLLSVLDACRWVEGVGLTYISSGGTVYGQPRRLPVDEEHPTQPLSSYGMLRLTCEHLCSYVASQAALPLRILRCANVYGENQPTDRGQGAVGVFVDHLLSGEPITLFGDGEVVRDYVYVGDVADTGLALLTVSVGERIVNIGSGQGHSLNDLIDLLERFSGRRFELHHESSRSFDISKIVLDVSRIKALVGFDPTPLKTGLERVLRAHGDAVAETAPGVSAMGG
jgi:UDP-glucose 4-epimerase